MNKHLLLIDGSNLAFRMYFALEMSNLRDTDGNPTWAAYGTIKALFDVIEFAKPNAAAVAFDLPEPTYRHEMFDAYKANRPDEMPDDLKPQWGLIKDVFRQLQIPVLEEAGFEADDLIGIMAKKAEANGYKVTILSGDKDLYQLINENISMAVPQRSGGLEIYTPQHVQEKLGVRPDQVPDYKGIAGDSSDNIPGVRGLGPKAAIKLLEEWGNLENIYENISKVSPPKMQEKLIAQEDNARLSKHIATIITDEAGVKTANLELEHCDLTLPDLNSLIAFLKKLQFNTILRRLPIVLKPFNNGELVKVAVGDLPEDNYQEKRITPNKKIFAENRDLYPGKWDNDLDKEIKNLEIKPFIVLDELLLNSFINKLNSVTQYAIDLETTGLNTLICEIAGFAFAYEENNEIKTFYIPVKHSNINTLALDLVINKLKPILEDSSKLQIIQNAKFEQKIFRRFGIKTHSNFFDTMLASYVNNPANKHGLKAQGKRVFALRMREIDELIGTGAKQVTIDLAPINDVASYASADAFVSFKLWKHYTETLSEEEKNLLYNIEFPLIEVLRDIEINGVSIDSALLKAQSLTIKQEISELESEIFSLCSSEFNIASPKQLSDILFDKLALPPVGRKNKSGSYSTDIDTLETLLVDDKVNSQNKKFIENIIQYRTLSKLISTYIDALPHLVSKEDNRLHSDFNQVVTATGRLSSSNPNLQNIPIKSKHGKLIRKAFIPRNSDYELISADYSQIELRVLADLASEPALIDAFRQDQDIHQRTAMEIFGHSSLDSVSEEERRVGKTLNFALIYMQGPFATSKQLGITMSEAKEFTDKYFRAFPKIKPFMDKVLEEAHEKECAETLFGRRRYFRNINSPNKILMKEEERQAFNAVIQGTAADIMKIAMIKLHQTLQSSQLQSQIILQVHDELVIEAHKTETDLVKTLITNSMSQAAELKVPLKVDLAIGPNWLDGN